MYPSFSFFLYTFMGERLELCYLCTATVETAVDVALWPKRRKKGKWWRAVVVAVEADGNKILCTAWRTKMSPNLYLSVIRLSMLLGSFTIEAKKAIGALAPAFMLVSEWIIVSPDFFVHYFHQLLPLFFLWDIYLINPKWKNIFLYNCHPSPCMCMLLFLFDTIMMYLYILKMTYAFWLLIGLKNRKTPNMVIFCSLRVSSYRMVILFDKIELPMIIQWLVCTFVVRV